MTFLPARPGALVGVEHALVEVDHAVGPRGRLRVVRHHDDRLAELLVQAPQQLEDLVARLRVEVARGLVGDQDLRVGHDRARDRDALLLAARELPRVVVHPVGEADDRERRLDVLAALGLLQSASAAAAARRSRRPSAPAAGCRAGR